MPLSDTRAVGHCLQCDQRKRLHNLLGIISAKFHTDQMRGHPNIKKYELKCKTATSLVTSSANRSLRSAGCHQPPRSSLTGRRRQQSCPGRAGLFRKGSTSSGEGNKSEGVGENSRRWLRCEELANMVEHNFLYDFSA